MQHDDDEADAADFEPQLKVLSSRVPGAFKDSENVGVSASISAAWAWEAVGPSKVEYRMESFAV